MKEERYRLFWQRDTLYQKNSALEEGVRGGKISIQLQRVQNTSVVKRLASS